LSSKEGDALKIPIEIKSDDLDEIRQLINDLAQAESDLRSLKASPRKGKGKGDDTSRSAFAEPEEKTGGMFGGQADKALPDKPGKDKTSKTPVQRENEFAKLRNQVNEQEARIGGGVGTAIQGGLGLATQGAGVGAILGKGGAKSALSSITSISSKAFLPLAIITTIIGLAENVLKDLLRDGGIMDRRFRRNARGESSNLSSLAEKAEFVQGERIIRVTTIGGQRGTQSQQRSNLDYIRNGVDVYDIHGVLHKGIGAGTI